MVSTEVKRLTTIVLVLSSMAVLAVFSIGVPTGPDTLLNISNERFTLLGPASRLAQAGNVSEITINAQAATKAWQGFYGNVSGNITLEDASGDVFYQWTADEPEGEIYASVNSTISWGGVQCFGFTDNAGGGTINLTTEEARYDMDQDDVDGIDETFNATDHDEFFVGTIQIANNTCPSTNTYVNSAYQQNEFQNMLLTHPAESALIFVTIIENRDPTNDTDVTGFDGRLHDFQLLVAEDEHTAAAQGGTLYYFFVEIE